MQGPPHPTASLCLLHAGLPDMVQGSGGKSGGGAIPCRLLLAPPPDFPPLPRPLVSSQVVCTARQQVNHRPAIGSLSFQQIWQPMPASLHAPCCTALSCPAHHDSTPADIDRHKCPLHTHTWSLTCIAPEMQGRGHPGWPARSAAALQPALQRSGRLGAPCQAPQVSPVPLLPDGMSLPVG